MRQKEQFGEPSTRGRLVTAADTNSQPMPDNEDRV